MLSHFYPALLAIAAPFIPKNKQLLSTEVLNTFLEGKTKRCPTIFFYKQNFKETH